MNGEFFNKKIYIHYLFQVLFFGLIGTRISVVQVLYINAIFKIYSTNLVLHCRVSFSEAKQIKEIILSLFCIYLAHAKPLLSQFCLVSQILIAFLNT